MTAKVERARHAILRALDEAPGPIGAAQLAGALLAMGVDVQPRTIRRHLLDLDRGGFTRLASRRLGRVITERGRAEVLTATEPGRLSPVSARIHSLAYKMTFDVQSGTGSVIANVSYLHPSMFAQAVNTIQLVVSQGMGIGSRIAVARSGERLADAPVPEGFLAIGTVCSMTWNGILQKAGIPVVSRFGGLLEIRDRRAVRFLNMIEYDGTTLDPVEVFMRADMTRVRDVALTGSGVVCAGFREIPFAAAEQVKAIDQRARARGLCGLLAVGRPNQPLLGIPVSDGHCGLVVYGGLNPVAAAREAGVRLTFRSLSGLEPIERFITTREALRRHRPVSP